MADSRRAIEEQIELARSSRDALGELLERCRPYLLLKAEREIGRLGGGIASRIDAEDVAQESLRTLCDKLAGFRGTSAKDLTNWLSSIARRCLIDAIRAQQAQKRGATPELLDQGQAQRSLEAPDDEPGPVEHAIAGEEGLRLAEALMSLPEREREAVRLHYLEGLPLREIADLLGCSRPTVAGMVRRGRARLRDRLVSSEASEAEGRKPPSPRAREPLPLELSGFTRRAFQGRRVDLRVGEVAANEVRMFILYLVHIGLCRRLEDFTTHFGQALAFRELITGLQAAGFLVQIRGELRLTEKGIFTLGDLASERVT